MVSSADNKRPRAGIALYQAAMANPTDYLGFLRLVHLRKFAAENPEFDKSLEDIWQPVRKITELIKKASVPIKPLFEQVIVEYGAQIRLIKADIARQGKQEKAEFDELIKEIQQATIRADEEWSNLFDCPRPKTTEDWQRLAVRAGLSADFVLQGQWTPEDVLPIIEGYLTRLKDQRAPLHYAEPLKHASRSKQKETPKRAWTLPELDKAVQEYKVAHAEQLQKIIAVLDNGKSTLVEKKAMRKEAQRIFGRNVIMRKFGVKGGKLVGQTTTWKSLSALLGLRSKATSMAMNLRREELMSSGKRVPMSSENEPRSVSADDEIMAKEREITLRCIREYSESGKKDAREHSKPIYEKYMKGEMSDDQAREVIRMLDRKRF